MSQELEIEFKNLLTKEEYDHLTNEFKLTGEHFTLQHNHYFDTKDFHLKESGCALRIREKNGKYELTLKQPVKEGLLETNQQLSEEEANLVLSNTKIPEGEVRSIVQSVLPAASLLEHFGTLSTKRAEVEYMGGVLVFDNSLYLNCEDFELEYEVKNRQAGEEIFIELLKTYEIPLRTTDNKIRRFFNEKVRQSGGK
ncbi:uncharacterized protein YjbK [Bacillus ectoiniformans]|uniref:CYTH domain-containing protein n=1 Tax=Bacillus ectoiniformans TaxID=1494429 RepID=UPI001958AC89|nr:uncharacterized protein YjbK [Bacillus ectoiniformans]